MTISEAQRNKMMKGVDDVLDEYNAGKLSKEQMIRCLTPVSAILEEEYNQTKEIK